MQMTSSIQHRWLASGFALLVVLGCKRNESENSTGANEATPTVEALRADADNTKKNERDRDGDTVTPEDQAENDADRSITQRIRQAVVDKDGLSVNAKNVKIMTANGVVTLRGPVQSAGEKSSIASIAQATAGVSRVDNQLEIATNEPSKE
jgi:hyperosmotically inducible periplasmic protein